MFEFFLGDLFRVRLFPRVRPRFGRRFEEDLTARIATQPMQVPDLPRFPAKLPTPAPFPTGPAANDPIFSIGKKLLRIGGAIIGGAVTIFDIIRMAQIELLNQKVSDLNSVFELLRRRRLDQLPKRVVEFPASDFPDATPTVPAPLPPAPPRPQTPDLPGRLPSTFPTVPTPRVPLPPQVPNIPLPGPLPAPLPVPLPGVGPAISPRVSALLRPVFAPLPITSPGALQDPQIFPTGDIFPLTPPNPLVSSFANPGIGTIQLPRIDPSPQTQTRRCQEVKRRRRRKGKCREGFFRERPGGTEFTTWRNFDC